MSKKKKKRREPEVVFLKIYLPKNILEGNTSARWNHKNKNLKQGNSGELKDQTDQPTWTGPVFATASGLQKCFRTTTALLRTWGETACVQLYLPPLDFVRKCHKTDLQLIPPYLVFQQTGSDLPCLKDMEPRGPPDNITLSRRPNLGDKTTWIPFYLMKRQLCSCTDMSIID